MGGVQAKLLAAIDAGVETVILPAENEQDVRHPSAFGHGHLHLKAKGFPRPMHYPFPAAPAGVVVSGVRPGFAHASRCAFIMVSTCSPSFQAGSSA